MQCGILYDNFYSSELSVLEFSESELSSLSSGFESLEEELSPFCVVTVTKGLLDSSCLLLFEPLVVGPVPPTVIAPLRTAAAVPYFIGAQLPHPFGE